MNRPALKKTISAGRWFYTTCTARLAKSNQYGATGGAMELSIGLVAVLGGLSFGVAWGIATLFIKNRQQNPAIFWIILLVCAVTIFKISVFYWELNNWIR